MPRKARVVIPGLPHHVTQRRNRRQDVFFGQADWQRHLGLLMHLCRKGQLAAQAYCLMGNHVHLIVVPKRADSLAGTLKPVHLCYVRQTNRRLGASDMLWRTGRPVGGEGFLGPLERAVGRRLRPLPVGRPRKRGRSRKWVSVPNFQASPIFKMG